MRWGDCKEGKDNEFVFNSVSEEVEKKEEIILSETKFKNDLLTEAKANFNDAYEETRRLALTLQRIREDLKSKV